MAAINAQLLLAQLPSLAFYIGAAVIIFTFLLLLRAVAVDLLGLRSVTPKGKAGPPPAAPLLFH